TSLAVYEPWTISAIGKMISPSPTKPRVAVTSIPESEQVRPPADGRVARTVGYRSLTRLTPISLSSKVSIWLSTSHIYNWRRQGQGVAA
ncbi:hypothetical protein J6590_042514, partial [Homalodisca vitripennis]